MPVIRLTLLTAICCLLMNSGQVQAVTPQIRLPEWNSTRISLAEWDPDRGILVISVAIKAEQVSLSKISSQLHVPEELNAPADRHERDTIAKGDKAVFMHKINVKPGFSGWFELDVRAMPNQEEMLKLAAQKHINEPLTGKVVEEEIKTIAAPIYIGTSLPVLLREDAALSTVPEAAFSNDLEADNSKFYLWYPPAGLGKGITAEGLKAYSSAIRSVSLIKSESAAKMLLRRFESNPDPVCIEKANGETFMLPTSVAADLITANQLTLRAVLEKKPQELTEKLSAMKPGYTRPFLYYNLAVLENDLNNRAQAIKNLNKALADQPAWPLAKKLLKKLKK